MGWWPWCCCGSHVYGAFLGLSVLKVYRLNDADGAFVDSALGEAATVFLRVDGGGDRFGLWLDNSSRQIADYDRDSLSHVATAGFPVTPVRLGSSNVPARLIELGADGNRYYAQYVDVSGTLHLRLYRWDGTSTTTVYDEAVPGITSSRSAVYGITADEDGVIVCSTESTAPAPTPFTFNGFRRITYAGSLTGTAAAPVVATPPLETLGFAVTGNGDGRWFLWIDDAAVPQRRYLYAYDGLTQAWSVDSTSHHYFPIAGYRDGGVLFRGYNTSVIRYGRLDPSGGLDWVTAADPVTNGTYGCTDPSGNAYVATRDGVRKLDPDGNTLWTTDVVDAMVAAGDLGSDLAGATIASTIDHRWGMFWSP